MFFYGSLCVDVVYMDFAKAFDKVCHERLIVKIEAAGISGKIKEWLEDWLRNRTQRVVVEGQPSEWKEVISSVVQGSVLGGTLFTIYIDDIDEGIRAFLGKFADDTKIAREIQDDGNREELQSDIAKLGEWADKWAMEFNIEKCKVMHIGAKNPGYEYFMKGNKLKETTWEKDLGVVIENNLKPTMQCEKAAKKANSVLGQITRSFHYRDKTVFVQLYKVFVRPHLEYASAVWNPWTAKDSEMVEKVQKRFVRMISNVRGNTYEEKLKEIGLTDLKERRMRGDLIETYKMMKGFNNVDRSKWFEFLSEETARNTRGNVTIDGERGEMKKDNIFLKRSNTEIRRNFFTLRVTKSWNKLEQRVQNASSVNKFKNELDKVMKGKGMEAQEKKKEATATDVKKNMMERETETVMATTANQLQQEPRETRK